MIYLLVVVIGGGIVVLTWYLTKEKREMPLPNETDLGPWLLPLPGLGYVEGRLTTARKTVEKQFETAISNAESDTEATVLQEARKVMLKYHPYAFKGSGKWLITSNRNLTDEKLYMPMGDRRLLKTPDAIIDRGKHSGFHAIHLEMPDPDKRGVKPEDRKKLSKLGDAMKYIKNAALNKEKVAEAFKERDFYKEEAELSHGTIAELRSKSERMARALSQKTLTGGEEPKVKGALRTRIEESGWRVIFSASAAGLAYAIANNIRLNIDPIIPLAIAGLAVFFAYPYVAKRL